jgi:hypothetical protein
MRAPRIFRAARKSAALLVAALVAGCGSGTGHGGGGGFSACPAGMNGILFIDWTVRGAAPGMTSCDGIVKLTLFLDNQLCGEVQIDPISCALDRFRYDQLPLGPAMVTLQGYDARDVLQIAGSGPVTLTAMLPAAPTTIALQ